MLRVLKVPPGRQPELVVDKAPARELMSNANLLMAELSGTDYGDPPFITRDRLSKENYPDHSFFNWLAHMIETEQQLRHLREHPRFNHMKLPKEDVTPGLRPYARVHVLLW